MKISKRFTNKVTKEEVLASKEVLDALKDLLEKDLEAEVRKQRSEVNYQLPSWPHFQADSIGCQRTLKKVIDLVTITED